MGRAPLKSWYFWVTHSSLQPVIDAARALKRHEAELLSSFVHLITRTNAGAEGLTSRIQAARVAARGYRNREQFKSAIYVHLGGLALDLKRTEIPEEPRLEG